MRERIYLTSALLFFVLVGPSYGAKPEPAALLPKTHVGSGQSKNSGCSNRGCSLRHSGCGSAAARPRLVTYDAANGKYEALANIDYLQPWQGFWIQSPALLAVAEVTVLFPKPANE